MRKSHVQLLAFAAALGLCSGFVTVTELRASTRTACEHDECRQLFYCHDAHTMPTGCDAGANGGAFCLTYDCKVE